MSLIKAKSKSKTKPVTLRVPEDVEADVSLYAEYLQEQEGDGEGEADRNHVFVEAARFVVGRDKQFQQWKAQRPARGTGESAGDGVKVAGAKGEPAAAAATAPRAVA